MSSIIEQPRYSCGISAQQTVLAIPGAHPILHSGPGCSERATMYSIYSGGFSGEGYCGASHISCTNSSQKEIIFGGTQKLRDTIDGAMKIIDADLYVVLTGCTADIVGDDSVGVAKEFAEKGYPVVGAETAGFKGSVYYGYSEVVKSIIEQYVGDTVPEVRKGTVNVFSVVPYQDPNWKEDLRIIKELLESIGLNVNILFGTGSAGVSEWKDIPNAQFNLLLSPWCGLDIVELLEEKYGTPYLQFSGIPVGAKQTTRFLRRTAEYAGIPKEKAEAVIEEKEHVYYDYFQQLIEFLEVYREDLPYLFNTVADSNYALGVSAFLNEEMGMLPQGVYITDDVKENFHEEIRGLLEQTDPSFEDRVIFQPDGGNAQRSIRSHFDDLKEMKEDPVLLLGSTWEKYLAEEIGAQYVPLSLPLSQTVTLNQSYAGYRGGINLVRAVVNNVF